ncbi:PhnA domain-containing protein [Sediminibacterium sp. KACHI17]
MKLEEILLNRSNQSCELCSSKASLQMYKVPPQDHAYAENTVMICSKCLAQVEKKEPLDYDHWRSLTETMWSEIPGVQVMAWRMLNRLSKESWAADQLDMLYLDEENLSWAKATGDHENDGEAELHTDAYGNFLQEGDTVILTKSLDIKGTSMSAKVGTVVKNIRLVKDNKEQIEGKIEGQMIVILTKYLKKQG